MSFADVLFPAWTNAYREGELQKLQMAQQSAQMSQADYVKQWMENNPQHGLTQAVAHIIGVPNAPSVLDQPVNYGAGGGISPQQQAIPTVPGQTGPTQMVTPAGQQGSVAQRYGEPQPDMSHPGSQAGGGVQPPEGRRIGKAPAFQFPKPAATPENVSMEHTQAQTDYTRAQTNRLNRVSTGSATPPGPGFTLDGVDVNEGTGNNIYHWKKDEPGSVQVLPESQARGLPDSAVHTQGGVTGPTPPGAPATPGQPPAHTGTPQVTTPRTPSPAAIPDQQTQDDFRFLGLTPPQPSGQQAGAPPAPPPAAPGVAAAGAPTPGAPPPPLPAATGAAPPAAAPPGAPAPAVRPAAAPGQAPTERAPLGPAPVSKRVGKVQVVGTPDKLTPMGYALTGAAAGTDQHAQQIQADINSYGLDGALRIPENVVAANEYLAEQRAKARGAPSLMGQYAHARTAKEQLDFNASPVEFPKGSGQMVSPFTALTDNPLWSTIAIQLGPLGDLVGPSWAVTYAEQNDDPRAIRIAGYVSAVQDIVRALGDVGNLSEGEQRVVMANLMVNKNTTARSAQDKHDNLMKLLDIVEKGLGQAIQGRSGDELKRPGNVDGANILRVAMANLHIAPTAQITSWSEGRDGERAGIYAAPGANVIGHQPPAPANQIGTTGEGSQVAP